MSVFNLIRTVFGLSSSSSNRSTSKSDRSTSDYAVDDETESDDAADDAAASDTDATASTGSLTEDMVDDEDVAKEPAEQGTDVSNHSGTDRSADEPGEAAGPVPTDPDEGAEPVENVSGIGPAYAKRLQDAGVETAQQLLDVDPADLADRTELSEKRIEGWQERAEDL